MIKCSGETEDRVGFYRVYAADSKQRRAADLARSPPCAPARAEVLLRVVCYRGGDRDDKMVPPVNELKTHAMGRVRLAQGARLSAHERLAVVDGPRGGTRVGRLKE
jgi:hypothetical protein